MGGFLYILVKAVISLHRDLQSAGSEAGSLSSPTMMRLLSPLVALVALLSSSTSAFTAHARTWVQCRQPSAVSSFSVTPVSSFVAPLAGPKATAAATAVRSRSAVSMSLFGLGGPEIAVIVAVAGFVLGPQKLAEMARDFGKVAGELKDVPKEFQEGLAEGDTAAKDTKEQLAAAKEPEDKPAEPAAAAGDTETETA